MKENYREQFIRDAKTASRSFEKSRRVLFRPTAYSLEELLNARELFLRQKDKWQAAIKVGLGSLSSEELDAIYMGLFHHEVIPSTGSRLKARLN
jgi:hypothetical protein